MAGGFVWVVGAGVIALSSVSRSEQGRWQQAASRESTRYGVSHAYTQARVAGRETGDITHRRTWVDWVVVGGATAILVGFASIARAPAIPVHGGWAAGLALVMLAALAGCGAVLWRTTRFS